MTRGMDRRPRALSTSQARPITCTGCGGWPAPVRVRVDRHRSPDPYCQTCAPTTSSTGPTPPGPASRDGHVTRGTGRDGTGHPLPHAGTSSTPTTSTTSTTSTTRNGRHPR